MRISGQTLRYLLASTFLATAAFTATALWDARPAAANASEAASAGATKDPIATATPAKSDQDGGKAVYAEPEKRVALVIGNSAYENVSKLANPANDAKAMSQFLNSAGFEVIAANDLNQDEMVQVLQDFSAKVSERGPNSVAFVYYAGHGVQIAGENYLVPVDARISSEADVPSQAVRLVDVMATLQAVPSRMRVVVLDACRNNPFTQLKDTGRGLAMVDAPNGSIVAYSTAPGTEAQDGAGSNSPYTSAFLQVAKEKNLPIEQVFKKVRLAVNESTEGAQTPWESSSLTNDFYFFGDTRDAMASAVMPQTETTRVAAARTIRSRPPREAYAMAVQQDSPESYEEFVSAYPQDPMAERIRRLLASRLLQVAWHGAVMANSAVAYQDFASKFSGNPLASEAQKLAMQPKMMPLYQPTKLLVSPQLAPQIKMTTFNGVAVPQGAANPINWMAMRRASAPQPPVGNGGVMFGQPGKVLPQQAELNTRPQVGPHFQPPTQQTSGTRPPIGPHFGQGNVPTPPTQTTGTRPPIGPHFNDGSGQGNVPTQTSGTRPPVGPHFGQGNVTTLPNQPKPNIGQGIPLKDAAVQSSRDRFRDRMQQQSATIKPVQVNPQPFNPQASRIGRRPGGPMMQTQMQPRTMQQRPMQQPSRVFNAPTRRVTMSSNSGFGGGGNGGGFGRMSFR